MFFFKAAIFDFDGLILDTESAEVQAWQIQFDELHAEVDPNWWQSSIGRGADQETIHPFDLLQKAVTYPLDRDAIISANLKKRIEIASGMPPREGVVDFIKQCHESIGHLAIASSSRHQWVDFFLEHLQIKHFFEAVLCADDVAKSKPDPDLYLAALDRLNVPAAEAIAFEDSPAGTEAAHKAGIYVVAVPNVLTKNLQFPFASAIVPTLAGKKISDFGPMLPVN